MYLVTVSDLPVRTAYDDDDDDDDDDDNDNEVDIDNRNYDVISNGKLEDDDSDIMIIDYHYY